MNRRILVVMLCLLPMSATSARSQENADLPRTLRIHDVGGLFLSPASHRATYQSDLRIYNGPYDEDYQHRLIFPADRDESAETHPLAAPGGAFNVNEDAKFAAEDGADELIRVIVSLIEPDSWRTASGKNSIERLGTSLIVSADEKTHSQVADLIAKLRQDRAQTPTISVASHWLWLTETELRELVKDDPPAETKPRDASRAYGLVDPAAFAKHLAAIESKDKDQRGGYRAAITCFDGQTVSAQSGRQSSVVSGFIPVVGDGNNVAFRPTHSIVKEGPAMQITPRLAATRKEVVLDVRARVSLREKVTDLPDVKEFGEETFYQGARRMSAMVEGRAMRVHQLATTVRTPLDKPMLIGGMTHGEDPKPGEPCLYLFVNVAAQQPANDAAPKK
jgi:hypothetical protein